MPAFASLAPFAVNSSASMQLKQAVDSAYQLFVENDVPSPRLNAELLLLFVLIANAPISTPTLSASLMKMSNRVTKK